MQKLQIIGNLGREPEMRYTPAGKPVTNFSVAVNRKYTGSDEQPVKETIWFDVSAWGRLAETCNQYLKKGSQVYVEGRLIADKATGGPQTFTRRDGSAGASFKVNAQQVEFLSGGGGNGDNPNASSGDSASSSGPVPAGEDIPF